MIQEIDLINRGLRMVGIRRITSLDEGSDVSTDAKLYWQNTLESFLETHMWSFATKEAKLDMLNQDKYNILGEEVVDNRNISWLCVHALPEDFVKLRKIIGWKEPRYAIYTYGDRLALFSNIQHVVVLYLSKLLPYDLMHASAREALSIRFAIFMDSVKNAGSNLNNLMQLYESMLHQAIRQEPATFNREFLNKGRLNEVRHDEPAAYRAQNQFCKWGSHSRYLE